MNNKLTEFNLSQRNSKKYPEFKTGDIVKVHRVIKEGEKERVQIFEGMIIAKKGGQSSSPTITVRKVSSGVGVELVLPIFSPSISNIEVVKKAKIRRSKLYYIRDKSVKSLRLKYKNMADSAVVKEEEAEVVSRNDSKEEKESKENKQEAPIAEDKIEKEEKTLAEEKKVVEKEVADKKEEK